MIFGFTLLAIVIAVGGVFFLRAQILMEENLKSQLKTTAAMAAMQFDGDAIEKIRNPSISNTAVKNLTSRLNTIRNEGQSVEFAYIMRRTEESETLQFVADADSLKSHDELDENRNGEVEEDEEPSMPGDMYDASGAPTLLVDAFVRPSVDDDFTVDQWGILISGYAPIVNSKGETVAILGLDMNAAQYINLSRSLFSPVALLLFFILAVFVVGYVMAYLSHRRLEDSQRLEAERSGMLMLAFHQLGTPLTIFKWSLEQMNDLIQKGPPYSNDLGSYVTEMNAGILKLNRVVNEISEVVSIERGDMAMTRECTLLKDVIVEVGREFIPRTSNTHQEVSINVEGDLCVLLDRKLLLGIFRELIENALLYSAHSTTVQIHAKRKGDVVFIDVSDEGIGMSNEEQKHIFEKFVRGKNAHIYDPNGNGIGLTIVKGIVERAGGRVWIHSQENKGTTVSFVLPLGEMKK